MPPRPPSGRARQQSIFVRGIGGERPAVPVDPHRLEAAARAAMSAEAFAYVAGGAGSERTVAANRDAFARWRIVPRVLRDVSTRDTSVDLFGARLPAPLLLAPVGVLEMAHRDADVAVARAAASLGVPMIFSNQASRSMEECARAMDAVSPGAPRWFQLYWSTSNELVASFVRRAEACGCGAIVLTLDTTMLGWRPRDLDLAYLPFLRGQGIAQYTSDPVFLASLSRPAPSAATPPTGSAAVGPPNAAAEPRPPVSVASLRALAGIVRRHPGALAAKLRSGAPRAAVQRFVATYSRPSLTWEDLAFLRGLTRLPILLKGVLHPDDARRALDAGVNGVVVSNHGGRQVDGAVAALDALPGVVDAVAGRLPVLFDSGVRGGADAFIALALGATAVCLGRPYVYGLALGGEAGVREVVANVCAELDLTMGLAGCRSVGEVSSGMVIRD
ncbi:MAG TPA: alpha-hydroxy-acid oxidizing protein [Gemmatimonadaceae bacterium]|nr:alpha-hydroxy-acid oxidizing protein [Gemmatimonadaceae bacterium]